MSQYNINACIIQAMIQRILHQCNNWYILIYSLCLLHNALARSTHYVAKNDAFCVDMVHNNKKLRSFKMNPSKIYTIKPKVQFCSMAALETVSELLLGLNKVVYTSQTSLISS